MRFLRAERGPRKRASASGAEKLLLCCGFVSMEGSIPSNAQDDGEAASAPAEPANRIGDARDAGPAIGTRKSRTDAQPEADPEGARRQQEFGVFPVACRIRARDGGHGAIMDCLCAWEPTAPCPTDGTVPERTNGIAAAERPAMR